MRSLLAISLLVLSLGCNSAKKMQTSSGELNGTWLPVREEIGGKPLPSAAYAQQRLTLTDGKYTLVAESVDKGDVTISGNKIDIYGKEGVNAGKHFTAIYKYEKDQLTICYNLSGDAYPKTFETAGKPMYFLSVFKREGK